VNPSHFVGIDPGFGGGIAVMNATATVCKAWPMPITQRNSKRDGTREYDLDGLHVIFKQLHFLPAPSVTIEWPTTRPGEGAERCERFGRGKGYLEAFLFLMGFNYVKVSPNIWKGRLGLPGKGDDPNSTQGAAYWKEKYPKYAQLILGPRGGVLDGLLDALLLAAYDRMGSQSPLGWRGGPRPAVFKGPTSDFSWKNL
jgi:hypothetical protein